MTFAYPDPNDAIAAAAIQRPARMSEADWLLADARLITEAAKCCARPLRRALDVGAGTGRLLSMIASVSDEVIAIEPDRVRGDIARKLHAPAVVVVCDVAGYAPVEPFDFIVCSHVLQHLPPDERAEAIDAMRRLAVAGSVLLVTYVCSGQRSGRLYRSLVGPDQTVITMDQTQWAESGGLMTWHFGVGEMQAALGEAGFTVLRSAPYRHFHHDVLDRRGRVVATAAADAYVIATVL